MQIAQVLPCICADSMASVRANVSEDGTRIAVSNGVRGFDVYSLGSGAPLCTVDHEIRRRIPTPSIWIHGSCALLGGSTAGQLTLWDVMNIDDAREEDKHPDILYRLPIPDQAEAVAIAVSIHFAILVEFMFTGL